MLITNYNKRRYGVVSLFPRLKDIFKDVKENQYAEDADPDGLTNSYNGEEID